MNPKISIIVPVYNTEKYVQFCLESLIKQTYKQLEILVINDGSTDNSKLICDKIAQQDNRIKVLTKNNGGLSDARNYGLINATGDYIGFVDSDDYVSENLYEELLTGILQKNADIAVAAINQVDEKGTVLAVRAIPESNIILSTYEGMKELLYSQRISNSVCNKLFKKELFSEIKFPVGKLYEDEYVTYKLFYKATSIYISSRAFYCYRYNANSITHSKFSEREFDRIIASEEKIKFCDNKYPQLSYLAKRYLVYDAIIALSKIENYEKRYDKYILKNIRKYLLIFVFGKNSLKAKAFAIVAAINPKIVSKLYSRIRK